MNDVAKRRKIVKRLAKQCGDAEIIVGVADPSLPWAAWVAEQLGLPLAYIREAKAYGRQRTIEGADTKGRRVALIGAETAPAALEAASVRIIPMKR